MYCPKCGNKINEGTKFCTECGEKIVQKAEKVETAEVKETKTKKVNETPHELKCWSIFAKVGFGCGIGSLATSFFITIGIIVGIVGIVFSILGKKSSIETQKAKAGLIMSIIGTSLSILFIIIWTTILIAEL